MVLKNFMHFFYLLQTYPNLNYKKKIIIIVIKYYTRNKIYHLGHATGIMS